jgi:subtilase family serine protease
VGVVVAIAVGAALWACGTSDQHGAPAPGSPTPSPKTGSVPLTLRAHPLARAEFDRGPLDPGKYLSNLSLVFRLTPEQIRERDALKNAQLDPGSPSYHKWLTPEQYAARFGAKPADIESARGWLTSQGLDVHGASRLGSRVTFSGTVDGIQRAFHADIHRYEVKGETHYAMATPAEVPVQLADAVLALTNTHDFNPRPIVHLQPAPSVDRLPEYTSGGTTGFAPPDWANVYDVAKLYTTGVQGHPVTGAGVTIAVVGVAQIAQSDIDAWRSTFGLPASTVQMTLVPNTGAAAPGSKGAGFEAVLDVEWSGGIGQGATVNYVFTGGNDGNVDDATYYAIENDLAPIISESWGGCEGPLFATGYTAGDQNVIDVYGSAANLLGITYVAASGDSGAAGCAQDSTPPTSGLYVNMPAAYPGVTAVGGTQFPTGSVSGTPYFTAYGTSEIGWNSGGGGISSLFTRPSYQSGVPTCSMVGSLPISGTVPGNMRMVPDVALTSAGGGGTVPELVECTFDNATGDCSPTGGAPRISPGVGTSFATPAFAGVVSLIEQVAGERLGNINPLLYAIARSTPTAFHDITTGNNEVSCTTSDPGCGSGGRYGYPATTGYDCATGLGSLDVYNLVSAWGALAPTSIALTASPTTTSEGEPVDLGATVTVTTPNGQALGGTVTYVFQSYATGGSVDLSWTIGTANLVGGSVSSATTSLSAAIPPGFVNPSAQYVDVVAEYGGDAYHLASVSPKVRIAFSPMAFCLDPATPTVQPGATQQFTSTSGVTPVKWYTGADTTCGTTGNCSSISETTGLFTAGTGAAGYVVVSALDADGAEVIAHVTVGIPTGTPPWGTTNVTSGCFTGAADAGADALPPPDSGTMADGGMLVDSGTTPDSGAHADSGSQSDSGSATDGSVSDASEEAGTGGSGNSSGCGCKVVNGSDRGTEGSVASLAFGLTLLTMRSRRRNRK